jgi:hypothetical protein
MNHQKTTPLQELYDEIPIANDVHRVFPNRVESKFLTKEFSIDSVRVTCHCRASEREDGNTWDERGKTVEIGEEGVGV